MTEKGKSKKKTAGEPNPRPRCLVAALARRRSCALAYYNWSVFVFHCAAGMDLRGNAERCWWLRPAPPGAATMPGSHEKTICIFNEPTQ